MHNPSAIPAVSIIMNCHNGAATLEEALCSVRMQTFTDYEIIFWDNASTDNSASIAKAFGVPMRYCYGSECLPLGAARNCALREARGRYIAFLDCDDVWLPQKLALQVAAMENNPAWALVCTDTEIFSGSLVLGRVFARSTPRSGQVFRELLLGQWITMSSVLLRRDMLEKLDSGGAVFDMQLQLCEEADVFYRLAYLHEIGYLPEVLTRWRVHGNNESMRKSALWAQETRQIVRKYEELYPHFAEQYANVKEAMLRRADFQEAVGLWRDGEGKAARTVLRPSLFLRKHRLLWWVTWLPSFCFPMIFRLYFLLRRREL